MGYNDIGLTGGYGRAALGSLTTTGANETARAITPSGVSIPLIQAKFITERYGPAETWVPVGVCYIVTTGITVTNAVVQLRKNGVAPTSGGLATLPIQAINANEFFSPFTPWTFAAADLPGDAWSVFVSTTSTAGVVNPVTLVYGVRVVAGVATGVAL